MEETGKYSKVYSPEVKSEDKKEVTKGKVKYGTPECVFPNIGPKGFCRTHQRGCITMEQYDEIIRNSG